MSSFPVTSLNVGLYTRCVASALYCKLGGRRVKWNYNKSSSMLIIFLLLPALSHASITFDITVSPIGDEVKVNRHGHDLKVISDVERQSFDLTDQYLKDAVRALYPDANTKDVYVKSPTPWGDLYKKHKWYQVVRETKVRRRNIQSFKNEQVLLMKTFYTNADAKYAAVNFENGTLADVDIVVRNLYNGTKMSVNVNHNINLRHGVKPLERLKFVSQLNENKLQKISKTFQVKSGLQFMLKPLQTIVVSLIAQKVTMEVRVLYTTRISGDIVIHDYKPNFNLKYLNPRNKRSVFRAYSVNSLLQARRKAQVWKDKSVLLIEYYANAKLVLKDKASGKVLQSVEVEYAD